MGRFKLAIAIVALFSLTLLTGGGPPQDPGAGPAIAAPHVPGEVLIRFAPGARTEDIGNVQAQLSARTMNVFLSGGMHWKLGPGISVEEAIARFQDHPLVQHVEPNYILSVDVIPDDPRLDELWGMINTGQTGGVPDADIDADMAWNVSTGSSNVVVAVIDTGVDYNHEDLAANMWTNPGEIPNNDQDDDGNGYVDDVHGYDFINSDGDPFDDNGHGTHCSGTIGAIGDNAVGVAGVNWNVSIMAVKFLSAGGSGSTADAVLSVDYATMMGAHLTSNSWGGGGYSQELYDAIARANAQDIAFVAAAGNDYGQNTDVTPHYPSSYDLPNIIAVAATDHNDDLASFSNIGPTTVDLGAPGDDIMSTVPGNSYGLKSGTSMATPHTAGVCALIRAVNPNIPMAQMKSVLLNATDPIPALAGKCVSEGRLNAFFAIAEPDTDPPGMIDDLATTGATSNSLFLSWTATGDDGEVGTASFYEVRYSTATIDDTNWDAATRAGNEPAPGPFGTPESMEVRNLDASTLYYFAVKAFDEWGNPGPLSNIASDSTLPPPTGEVDPTSITDDLFTGEQADHYVTLSNTGVGTLDYTIPAPLLNEPYGAPAEPLELGKGEVDPRHGDPVVENQGGPDAFGYRWMDSDEPGGPVFNWTDISSTGMSLGVVSTNDDWTSAPVALGFDFPFYGTLFDSIRVCTNGWLSFTSSATSYSNQPLPTSGAPENLVAPFWDDLHPHTVGQIYVEQMGNQMVVQWNNMERYSGAGAYTFQAILDASGSITYQYLTLTGDLESATIGIQDASKTVGLEVAFNQAFLHDEMAVRIAAIPQWLTPSPTSGRLWGGESDLINLHMDASGLEGGHYPGTVNILTNDPVNPTLTVDVTLHVIGAPDAEVEPDSLEYGDTFAGLPKSLSLMVINNGTDTLNVTDIVPSHPELDPQPRVFDVAPHAAQSVTVEWTPSTLGAFSGSVTVQSNDAGEPAIVVPCTGNGIPAPVMVYDPTSFSETLFSGNDVTRTLTVSNTGGSDLILDAAADLGEGALVYARGEGTTGAGGPDEFGYSWRDSDESGGPVFDWFDISSIGTPIDLGPPPADDDNSGPIPIGFTFPFYGNNFATVNVCSNGWLSFTSTRTTYSNVELPSDAYGKPENLIAPFWDDLRFSSSGADAHYYNDGSRFIVQFTDVQRYYSTGSLTFQVILYPSGKIVYQYLSMTGTLNSATIGIQNDARDIGLTVSHNTNYVHDELAIQISRTPDWLEVTPTHAVIPPGGESIFDVKFDSTDQNAGVLEGAVVLMTNIPGQEEERIPATLTVIGAPKVRLIPEEYDYGTHFFGSPYMTQFQVVNDGTDALNVSNIYTTDPTLTVLEPGPGGEEQIPELAFQLQPGEARLFDLEWLPTSPMALVAAVRVVSDDPITPNAVLDIRGVAIPPPEAHWTPTSFSEDLMVGDVVHQTLRLENHGGSDLDFFSSVFLDSGATVVVDHSPELKKDEPDTRPGMLGSGGPDIFGYTWKDSDEPGGPTFNWIDISAIGTLIPFSTPDDNNHGPIPIGFPFPFYGQEFDTVRVCTNGFLSFTYTYTSLTNYLLPSTSAPPNLLAVFHDDLHRRNGNAYYYSDGTKFIVQYSDWDQYSPSGQDYDFQVILYRNGRIVYQYLSMTTGDLEGATIGIQNEARNDGLTVVYNDPYMHDALAVEFRPPAGWLSVAPDSGTVPAFGAIDLDVTFDVTELIGGDYFASIELITNDPDHELIQVPVSLHATGIPDIDSVPPSLTFPTTFVGFSSSMGLTIQNVGTDVLHITDVQVSGDYSQVGLSPPIDLPVGGTIPVTIEFAPTTDGTRTGILTVVSDDPDEAAFEVPLQGEGLYPPEIGSTPDEITTALPPGGSRTKTLTIHNTGGSDLYWNGATNTLSGAGGVTVYDSPDLGKGEVDTRPGILGSGGPDMYGYTWKDSDEPGGPVYDWVDISGVGTPIRTTYGDDYNDGPFPIGFTFNFYGNAFTEFRTSTNGWVSFTSTVTDYSNDPLPSSGGPENLLAVFWDDLVFRTAQGPSGMYYYNDGTRLIIQYENMFRIANYSDDINFQIHLYPSGKIVYQYETISIAGASDQISHTIGIQNATRDDGLTVVFNDTYIHDNMAIEFSTGPDWIQLDPDSGTIPAGESQEIDVLLNAAGLEDGIHEGDIELTSNDPYTPLYVVPVTLNVSLVDATWVNYDPDVLNLGANGRFVKVVVELPPELNPYDIRLSSVTLNGTVPALEHPAPDYSDLDENGIMEVAFKFDRQAVSAILPEGDNVPVTIQGEVFDVQWWTGTDYIRTMNPRVTAPVGGEYYHAGQIVPIRWDPPALGTPSSYRVHLSRNDQETWEEIGTGLTGTSLDWTATEPLTGLARIRVFAMDNNEPMGQDTNDGIFTIASTELQPPHPVDHDGMYLNFDGATLRIDWKAPPSDPTHGPADRYPVLRGEDASLPLTEVAEMTDLWYEEPDSATGEATTIFYHIVAANAAGETP